jgi:hypothetical protein
MRHAWRMLADRIYPPALRGQLRRGLHASRQTNAIQRHGPQGNHLVDASNGDERDGSSTAPASPTHAAFQHAPLNRFAGFCTQPLKFIPSQLMIQTWQLNRRVSTFAESTANRVSASAACRTREEIREWKGMTDHRRHEIISDRARRAAKLPATTTPAPQTSAP